MTNLELFDLLSTHGQAKHCLETLRRIWENDRLFSFDAFGRTAAYCAEKMREIGLADVETLPLAADGRTLYGDWVIPQAWDARSARLEIVCPVLTDPLLAAYPDVPCSLVMYSAPTPPEGVEGELLLIEDPAAITGLDLRGKLLFLRSARPQALLPAAIQGGALGIVSDFFPLTPGVRNSKGEMAEHSRWENAFATPRNESGLFAFSLAPKQGDRLEALLAQGPVHLRAQVDARLYDGTAATVSALLPGQTQEEVLAYGHLYEPGAEDNASGCAALLEAVKILRDLIEQGLLPMPQRGIRIALGFECGGSMGYFAAHPQRIGHTHGGLVADMVGTQDIDRATLTLWHNPQANYGAVDRLMVDLIHTIGLRMPFPYRQIPFTIGTDNILSDPYFRMPTVALIAEPALSYHSSMDHPERIEPDILLRNTLLCAMYLYRIASLPDDQLLPDPPPPLEGLLRHDSRIPKRSVMGCLCFDAGPKLDKMTDAQRRRWHPAWSDRLNTPLFWTDGQRSLGEIITRSARELAVEDPAAYADELTEYFTFLGDHGYIEFI